MELELIATHALHNAFITTQETDYGWPEKEHGDRIPAGTILNVREISIRPTESPFDAFEVWAKVEWRDGDDCAKDWDWPLSFLTDRCDMLEFDIEVSEYH